MTLKKLLIGGLILAKALLPFNANAESNTEYGPYLSIDPAIVSTVGNHDNGSLGIQGSFGSNTTRLGINSGLRFEENFSGYANVMWGYGLNLEREFSPSWSTGIGLERFFSSSGNYYDEDNIYDPSITGKGKMNLINLFIKKDLFSSDEREISLGISGNYKWGNFTSTGDGAPSEYDNFTFQEPSLEVKFSYSLK
jgi:hypothetical protein